MLAVAKTPHIDLRIVGETIPKRILAALEIEYGDDLKILDDEDELVNVRDTEWFRSIRAEMTVGDVLRIRRENAGLTQQELSAKTGISQCNIAAMETGLRTIGLSVAKKLAAALDVPVAEFQKPWR
ncbi:MAG: helix-turn-helix transcriptional regulator [Desulfobulbaceae bacterium]|jgi:ribosome-binding protein aMBF1 (putative translation factor)|nr:helix-turn-helix transcriptional regulator [Desulfobulbaceae bacterium]